MGEASPLYVACSGGADSVFALLLCWLYSEGNDGRFTLKCLHFDHQLRGAEATTDAKFVEAMCRSLSIPCEVGKAGWSKPVSEINEDDARRARIAFFQRVVKADLGEGGAARIVTGHHADDVVESMLMRLSRGANLQGLSAPRSISDAGKRIRFVRPLLAFGRDEIRQALEAAEVDWREDATNDSGKNYRSRLRKGVIAEWESAADRKVRPGVIRSRSLLEEDWRALESFASDAWKRCYSSEWDGLDRRAFAREPRAIQRRLLVRLAESAETTLSAGVVDAFLDAIEAGESDLKFEIEKSVFLMLEGNLVRMSFCERGSLPDWRKFRLPAGCRAYLPDGSQLGMQIVKVSPSQLERLRSGENDDAREVYLSFEEKQRHSVCVRRRQPGDAIKPIGRTSPRKIKDLLINRKIKVGERDWLPVFHLDGGNIVWVPGLAPSGDYLLEATATSALRLTYWR